MRDHDNKGTPGHAGATGSGGTGNVGSPGSAGTSGVAGTTGSGGDNVAGAGGDATGTGGHAGAAGDFGTAGTAGNSAGAAGAIGSGGTTGSAGTTGSGGTTGAGGSGSAGTTGTGGTNPANNLITNGDFSAGSNNWHTENGTGNVNNGAYCVGSPSGSTLIGWDATSGSPVTLSGGTTYKISYQASGAGTVHLKVGMAASPYGDIYTADDGISGSLQTFTHTFMPTSTQQIGLAFTFSNAGTSTVCIDNVALTPN